MSFLIALEGIDGSGKGTQARRLDERLDEAGIKAALLSFPRYEATLFGQSIGDYLNGRFGALDEVSPYLVSLLYAGDRFESRRILSEALAHNEIVILDRYVPSNLAHQGAKVPEAQRAELLDWIRRVEYGIFELPRPDLVLLLDVPVAEGQKRIAAKAQRSYTERAADLHEADAGYLQRVREVYLQLADEEPNWHRIAAEADDRLRTVDEIAEEVWQTVRARQRRTEE